MERWMERVKGRKGVKRGEKGRSEGERMKVEERWKERVKKGIREREQKG